MSATPILVSGMHRSGTSLAGSFLAACGVDMGERLIPADEKNPRGYFEDADIVAFHGRAFDAACPRATGHRDWGWTEDGEVDAATLVPWAEEAAQLLRDRADRARGAFGFKDPRATMALELWDRVAEDARWVFTYRYPWEVADSMQRIGADVFAENPSYGYRIWAAYNRRVVTFVEAHRERCLLLSTNALAGALGGLPELFAERLGLDAPDVGLAELFDSGLLTTGAEDDARAALTGVAYPECTELLARLDDLADVSSSGRWSAPTDWSPTEWSAMGEPDVSIVVPTYRDGVFLIEALASVEQARPANTELVVVNDGSPDPETRRIVGALAGRGYSVIERENGGLSAARNTGIEASRGRYVLPLDADNRLRRGFVEAAVARLDADPSIGVVYGDRELFGAARGRVDVPDFDFARQLGGNQIDACAVFRRELWDDLGGYDTAMFGLEDWEFWIHAADRGWSFSHLREVAFDYRVRPGSLLAVCLEPSKRRLLFAHLLEKHVELLHRHVPSPIRAASFLLGLVGLRSRRLRRWEARSFWRPFWWLMGPGGVFDARGRTDHG